MRFINLSLQNYRNISLAHIQFEQKDCFFLGPNGQGKTNILEALGLVTTLRSFRTHDNKALVKQGEKQASLLYQVDHEHLGQVELRIDLKPKQKQITLAGEPVSRFADFIGLFPVVVLCSEDSSLLLGAPTLRRRFLDMTLSAVDAAYFESLRAYVRAYQARNALLKEACPCDALLGSFEHMMSQHAPAITAKRKELVSTLTRQLQFVYSSIATAEELPELIYQPDLDLEDPAAYASFWEGERKRDKLMKATQRGPHRDDFLFKLKNKHARIYASEGQQRAFVTALRLAQASYYKTSLGILPVILIDDVLGSLDTERKTRFWSYLEAGHQVVATGTSKPEITSEASWLIHPVCSGEVLQGSTFSLI